MTPQQKQTGWPAIGTLTFLFVAVFASGLVTSGHSLDEFYQEWLIPTWVAAAFIGLCILAELSRLKCPHCRSRAIRLLSAEEVDRWIGQKVVTENTVNVGAFQTFGQPKFKGATESVSVGTRTIPVTKRRIVRDHRCDTCGYQFQRQVVEEML